MVEDSLEGGKEAILFGGEMLVEDSGGDRGVLDDFGDRRHPVAALGNKVDDGGEEALALGLGDLLGGEAVMAAGKGAQLGAGPACPVASLWRHGARVSAFRKRSGTVGRQGAGGQRGRRAAKRHQEAPQREIRRQPAQQLDLKDPGPEWARLPPNALAPATRCWLTPCG